MGEVGARGVEERASVPDSSRERSYEGGYMEAGRESEEVLLSYLRSRRWVREVYDLRDVDAMRAADVDVGLELTDGRYVTAELKRDWHLGVSGNVLYEMLRVNHHAPPDRAAVLGWTARSPADLFLLHAPQVRKVYTCRADDLRRAFAEYTAEARGETKTIWIPTDEGKSTLCALLPETACAGVLTERKLPPGPVDPLGSTRKDGS